jgi:hypothetical protein
MSRLNIDDRVQQTGDALLEQHRRYGYGYALCEWFAKCTNPANGLRDHPVLGQVPICQRCDDKIERLRD